MKKMVMNNNDKIEEMIIIVGLVLTQFVYAGNSVLMSYLMSLRINPLTLVIFSSFATFLVTAPLASYFERSKWPKKLTLGLIFQIVMIAFGGITLFQSLFLEGMKLTSPALATAMPNLAPGLIFIIAWTLRLERVRLSCIYSRVKIAGTILCVVGALTMSLMHSTRRSNLTEDELPPPLLAAADIIFDRDRIIGCVYLLGAVFCLSSTIVLQAKTLGKFPAPMSLSAITSLIGVGLAAMTELYQELRLDFGWSVISIGDIIVYSFLGGGVGGAIASFTGWAMRKRGPVFVSMFNPIATVVSIILSMITLGDTIKLGSIAGMLVMFSGLYFVLWAKGKEGHFNVGVDENSDPLKPLLS